MLRRNKRAKLAEVAAKVPTELIQEHGGLDTVDLILLLMVTNHENRYIVVEALAGCGKTAMLTGLVRRINQKSAVLLLSFTRQAITVARLRAGDEINVQTFDSLFFQTVKHGFSKEMGKDLANTDEYTYESFRDLSETLSEEDLRDFVGKTTEKYRMDEIEFIMVDEAQDTPPQAWRILETFREMGKTVIITGDRHQAIFGFMRTESLFDMIPAAQKTVHFLKKTKRCCHEVVEYLNKRFALGMESAYTSRMGPDAVDSVCVQTLYNATLGRIYAKFLFTMNAPVKVCVSDGDSTDKFWEAVHHETSRIYSVSVLKASEIVKQRQRELEKRHRLWEQTPRQWRLPIFVFSTVHHFKGGECDVTILGEDLDLDTKTDDVDQERVKYVAGSRARWGIVEIKNFQWIGHPAARKMFRQAFLKSRENASKGTAPRVSSVSDLPSCIVPLISSPILDAWTAEFRQKFHRMTATIGEIATNTKLSPPAAMKVGSLVDIMLGWRLERMARQHNVPDIHICSSEYGANPLKDRKYARMKRENGIPPELHAELRRIIARMKIQATVGRYLVVFCGWQPTRPLVVKAALAKARLQSFMLCCNVASLERTRLPLAARVRVVQIMEQIERDGLPDILGRPQDWLTLNLQQQMTPNPFFFYRGSYDVLITDRTYVSHLVEVKTVRNLHPSHALQALLYSTVIHTSLGRHPQIASRWQTYIYEANRNQLCSLEPSQLLRLAAENEAILPELDTMLYAKVLPDYYPSVLSLDTIVSIV